MGCWPCKLSSHFLLKLGEGLASVPLHPPQLRRTPVAVGHDRDRGGWEAGFGDGAAAPWLCGPSMRGRMRALVSGAGMVLV